MEQQRAEDVTAVTPGGTAPRSVGFDGPVPGDAVGTRRGRFGVRPSDSAQPVSFCPADSTLGVDVTAPANRARGNSALLSDGLAASDANGSVVPSGFIRLEAFRTGVLDGDSACLSTCK
ncbi:hypothetical protein [Nocardia acidivorans]|uniref:hypothetical protein n=1 Tax=Nocardia acidivorans TaxID=404580 RepID=UPI0012F7FDF0|nr:hypothetical protein [Nocardia acidivorans]